MKDINVDVVPALPLKAVECGECVAYGITDFGVLVHYIDKDKARLVEWEDIINLGLQDILTPITDAKKIREVKKPAKPQ